VLPLSSRAGDTQVDAEMSNGRSGLLHIGAANQSHRKGKDDRSWSWPTERGNSEGEKILMQKNFSVPMW